MKKSNVILLIGVITVILFFFTFHITMRSHLKSGKIQIVKSEIISQERNVSGFKKIAVSHGIYVYFQQDSTTMIKIEAPENILTYIKTEVIDEKLIIEKIERITKKDSIKVFISNNQLEELKINSESHFETLSEVSGTHLELSFNDESTGDLELSYTSVKCEAMSGAKVKIKGDSDQIDLSN